MISSAIRLIADELDAYLAASGIGAVVTLGNVADLEQENTAALRERILVTMVNIEEESTLKNSLPPSFNNAVGGLSYEEPPVYVNLYLLFSATYEQRPDGYETALNRLASVIRFFQVRRTFSVQNSPNGSLVASTQVSQEDKNYLRLYLELYTLTFEQINHLWGSLGGKQVPFVMYKMRLVRLRDRATTGTGPVIEEVGTDERVLTGNGQMPNP